MKTRLLKMTRKLHMQNLFTEWITTALLTQDLVTIGPRNQGCSRRPNITTISEQWEYSDKGEVFFFFS